MVQVLLNSFSRSPLEFVHSTLLHMFIINVWYLKTHFSSCHFTEKPLKESELVQGVLSSSWTTSTEDDDPTLLVVYKRREANIAWPPKSQLIKKLSEAKMST